MSNQNVKRTSIALWVIQTLLAALFIFAGGMKLVLPIAVLTQQAPIPGAILRAIGVLELLGGFGLILPGLFRLRGALTSLAAAGLILIMSGATAATLATGQPGAIVPVIVGVLLLAVGYGRWQVAPHRTFSRIQSA
jgi:hypothetical protein